MISKDVRTREDSSGLPRIEKGEIAVSGPGLQAAGFVSGKGDTLLRFKKYFQLPEDPKIYFNSTFEVVIDNQPYIFTAKLNASAAVWTFPAADCKNFITLLDPAVKQDEIVLSQTGLREAGVAGAADELAKRAKQVFKLPEKIEPYVNQTFECCSGDKLYKFIGRICGSNYVWTFKRTFLDDVKNKLDLSVRPGEIAVSQSGMKDAGFSGPSADLVIRLKNIFRLPEDLKNYLGKTFEVFIGKKNYVFTGRLNGKRPVWTFSSHHLESVKELLNQNVRALETVVSEAGFKACDLAKSARDSVQRFRSIFKLPVDPENFLNQTYEASVDGRRYIFTGRLTGPSSAVWAFSNDYLNEFKDLLDLSVRPNEIVVSEAGLRDAGFVGNTHSLARSFKQRFGLSKSPEDYLNRPFEVKINDEVYTFTARLSGPQAVWVFSQSSLLAVVRAFGTEIDVSKTDLFHESDLAEAVALLGKDPLKLHNYIKFVYPELLPRSVIKLSVAAVQGLGGSSERYEFSNYKIKLDSPLIISPPLDHTTIENSFRLSGRAPTSAEFLYLEGAYSKLIPLDGEGGFDVRVPLPKTGETNQFVLSAVNSEKKYISAPIEFAVYQTGEKQDLEEVFRKLLLPERSSRKPKNNQKDLWQSLLKWRKDRCA